MRQAGFPLRVKRAIDLSVAGLGLVVAAPLLLATAVAILVLMGRPVLFIQTRPGRHARPFRLIKFRTMSHVESTVGNPPNDALRLTSFGRFLRATSIDELPELWNVLNGSMSLVGPRPLLMKYLARYNAAEARRHEVFPGITGWAQINGRNDTTWDDRFSRDVWYVDNWTVWLDVKILFLTLAPVVARRGVSRQGHATMPEFGANERPSGDQSARNHGD